MIRLLFFFLSTPYNTLHVEHGAINEITISLPNENSRNRNESQRGGGRLARQQVEFCEEGKGAERERESVMWCGGFFLCVEEEGEGRKIWINLNNEEDASFRREKRGGEGARELGRKEGV